MRKKRPQAGPLQLLPVGEDGASALRFALADLIHELYFKKPHFPGNRLAFTRAEHDRANAALSAVASDVAAMSPDPISELLAHAGALSVEAGTTAPLNQLLADWERSESPLNARTRALVGLMGPERAAKLFRRLLPIPVDLTMLWVADLSSRYEGKRADGKFGQPDLLLSGDLCTLLIEMKVRGKAAQACYDVKQLLDYLSLTAALRTAGSCAEPIVHVVLAPTGAGGLFKQGRRWLAEVPKASGVLRVDSEGFAATLRSMRNRRRPIPEGRIEAAIEQLPMTSIVYVGLEQMLMEAARLLDGLGDWEPLARLQHRRLGELAVRAELMETA